MKDHPEDGGRGGSDSVGVEGMFMWLSLLCVSQYSIIYVIILLRHNLPLFPVIIIISDLLNYPTVPLYTDIMLITVMLKHLTAAKVNCRHYDSVISLLILLFYYHDCILTPGSYSPSPFSFTCYFIVRGLTVYHYGIVTKEKQKGVTYIPPW